MIKLSSEASKYKNEFMTLIRNMFSPFVIRIYNGNMPSNVIFSATGTLLWQSAEYNFDIQDDIFTMNTDNIKETKVLYNGIAKYARFAKPDDTNEFSFTSPRKDCLVCCKGITTAEISLTNINLYESQEMSIKKLSNIQIPEFYWLFPEWVKEYKNKQVK